jgi:YbbR domain-containing protein
MPADNERSIESHQLAIYFKNILRKVFLEDWAMKLLALVITFALWVGVTGLSTPTVQRMTGIPLTLRFSSAVDVTSTVQEIDVVISGDKRKIDQINKNDLIVSLDLTDSQPGDQVITLTPTTVSLALPTGIKLEEIQPRQIPVKIESVEVKEVPVNVLTEGQVPEGFEVYGQAITPQRVRVRGPSGIMRSLASVSTGKINLANRTADFTQQQVSVDVSNPKAVLLDTLVDVTFRIGEKRIERMYSVPVADDPKRKVQVLLYGGRSLFEGISAEDITVTMVKDDAGNDRPSVTLPSQLADRVEIRRPRPAR